MLKKRMTKEEYESLKKPIGYNLATEGEHAGKYVFEGFEEDEEDMGALLRGKKRETDEKNQFKKLADEYKLKLEDLTAKHEEANDSLKKIKGTQSERDALFQKQIDSLKSDFNAKEAKLKQKAEQGEIEKIVSSFAPSWVDKAEELGSLAIKSRVKIKEHEGELKPVFLDKRGQETLMNFEEFKKNVLADESLHPIIRANQSSGGGATGNSYKGSAPVDFSKMTATDKALLKKTDPSAYQNLLSNTKK